MILGIKMFERGEGESVEDFEKRINDFLCNTQPTQIHYQDAGRIYFIYQRMAPATPIIFDARKGN